MIDADGEITNSDELALLRMIHEVCEHAEQLGAAEPLLARVLATLAEWYGGRGGIPARIEPVGSISDAAWDLLRVPSDAVLIDEEGLCLVSGES
jgi:hypothetical protein